MTRPELAQAVQGADVIHESSVLEAAIRRMGGEIDQQLAGESAVFLTIMQGGLIFAGQLATHISAPLEFDYVHATRFRGGLTGGELSWMHQPATSLSGRTVLLVDDILDEGHTLKAIRDFCVAAGASKVLIAVLCEKRHDRTVPDLRADFVGVEVPDRYVFGYGMDYHEQGRNLNSILAL